MARKHPLILVSALTGAQYHPQDYPNIAVLPHRVAQDAARVQDAGAAFAHIHARNPETGHQFASKAWYETVRGLVRNQAPGLGIGFPTSRKGEVGHQIQAALDASQLAGGSHRLTVEQIVECELIRALSITARPDTITTFTAPEIRLAGNDVAGDDVRAAVGSYQRDVDRKWSDPAIMRLYYRQLRNLCRTFGVHEELEVTTWGAFEVLTKVALDPTLGMHRRPHWVLLFGFSSRLPINFETYQLALREVDRFAEATGVRPAITVGAVIRPAEAVRVVRSHGSPLPEGEHDYREVLEWVLADDRVDAFRVGLEDTPLLYGEPQSNAGLVQAAAAICKEHGVSIETHRSQVLSTLGIAAVDQPQ